MSALLTVSAAMELGAGLGLLGLPAFTVTLLIGARLEDAAALVVARIAGAGLLALGVACWLARERGPAQDARALVVAMLVYDVAAAIILASGALVHGLHGALLWPAVVLHAAMGAWCTVSLQPR